MRFKSGKLRKAEKNPFLQHKLIFSYFALLLWITDRFNPFQDLKIIQINQSEKEKLLFGLLFTVYSHFQPVSRVVAKKKKLGTIDLLQSYLEVTCVYVDIHEVCRCCRCVGLYLQQLFLTFQLADLRLTVRPLLVTVHFILMKKSRSVLSSLPFLPKPLPGKHTQSRGKSVRDYSCCTISRCATFCCHESLSCILLLAEVLHLLHLLHLSSTVSSVKILSMDENVPNNIT